MENISSLINLIESSPSLTIAIPVYEGIRYLLTIVIFLGNGLTLCCVYKYEFLRCTKHILIISLSVLDICTGITDVFRVIYFTKIDPYRYFLEWTYPDIIYVTLLYISMGHILMIGIDKFIAITYPLRYDVIVSKRIIWIMVSVAWLYAVVCFVPVYCYLIYLDTSESIDDIDMGLTLSIGGSIVTILIVIYAKIWRIAKIQSMRTNVFTVELDKNQFRQNVSHSHQRQSRKVSTIKATLSVLKPTKPMRVPL